jgi:hypothetical protein
MSDDIITRARKEWCESPEPANYPASRLQRYTAPCPPEVVAALLDVLIDSAGTAYCGACGKLAHMKEHDPRCCVGVAEAVITRALEGKT